MKLRDLWVYPLPGLWIPLGAAVVLLLLIAACSTPTLQQRQANWLHFQQGTRATYAVGQADPAMPPEVCDWCGRVASP